jgi:hypothetical protein
MELEHKVGQKVESSLRMSLLSSLPPTFYPLSSLPFPPLSSPLTTVKGVNLSSTSIT